LDLADVDVEAADFGAGFFVFTAPAARPVRRQAARIVLRSLRNGKSLFYNVGRAGLGRVPGAAKSKASPETGL
jgi:hypothetical protein